MMMVESIRKKLFCLLNKKIKIIYCGSRNKKEVYYGYVFKLYLNVFVIKNDYNETKCFSYVDVLTKTVKIIY